MTVLLQKLIGWIITPILTWLIGWISSAIQRARIMAEAKKIIEEKNAQVLAVTEKAVTKEERDRAAEEVIRNL